MIVNSHNIEFGYELISVIPYANCLASKALLTETISGNDTECLYYFSPKHTINTEPRSWYNTPKCTTPNIKIHTNKLDKSQFLAPDYKNRYANDRFKFDKETVIICNRINVEWSTKPINYFDLETLKKMFDLLSNKYQIVYINIEGRPELYDNENPISIGDYDLLKSYPKVINIHDLHRENSDLTFNELQLMLFANCQKFITMNGGHALLAAYFGGENIIMSKQGKVQAQELKENVNSFYRWYHEFAGQRISLVHNEQDLIDRIRMQWIDCEPVVNILVRTSNRPFAFDRCIDSIVKQTYKNVNIIVSIDDEKNDYTVKYPVHPVHVEKTKHRIEPINDNPNYGLPFHSNLYFNEMYKLCKPGLIIFLDDDDKFSVNDALQNIVDKYKQGSEYILWKVRNKRAIHPSSENFGKQPVCCDICGIGIAFDAKYKGLAEWEPYKRGDFRIADKLYKFIDKKAWINAVFTETQNGHGFGKKLDIVRRINKLSDMQNLIEIKIVKNILNGKHTGHVIGMVKKVEYSTGLALIKSGIAVENVPELEIKIETPESKIEKVIEPVIEAKEQPKKRGRKK